MTKPFHLPEATICDMNCFLSPDHKGPHQSQWEYDICECCEGTGVVRLVGGSKP